MILHPHRPNSFTSFKLFTLEPNKLHRTTAHEYNMDGWTHIMATNLHITHTMHTCVDITHTCLGIICTTIITIITIIVALALAIASSPFHSELVAD